MHATQLIQAHFSSPASSTELAISLTSDTPLFQQPSPHALAALFARFAQERDDITQLSALLNHTHGRALNALIVAAGGHLPVSIQSLQNPAQAHKILSAAFWQQALELTDVREFMPQTVRADWDQLIASRNTPDFAPETVIPTLKDLLGMRERHLAQTIDGVFQALSGDHVTNIPQGFYHRMIMPSKYGKGKSEPTEQVKGYIADLRAVVAFFMGRKGLSLHQTSTQIDIAAKTPGQWVHLDGGAIKIRVYQVGTVHVEVHPEMAWRLNHMLSLLYPQALPADVRKANKYAAQERPLSNHLLSGAALQLLSTFRHPQMTNPNRPYDEKGIPDKSMYCLPYDVRHLDAMPQGWAELAVALEACGGTLCYSRDKMPGFRFDFPFEPLRESLLLTGAVPEQKSHQFYRTHAELSARAAAWADILPNHRCLEPSAGQGDLVAFMPASTMCVEISKVHCAILQAKGYTATCADFLSWATTAGQYDRIVMNPPYTGNQAVEHTQQAAALLGDDGVLVAILPASLQHTTIAPGFHHEWSEVIEGAFVDVGTSVRVTLLRLSRI